MSKLLDLIIETQQEFDDIGVLTILGPEHDVYEEEDKDAFNLDPNKGSISYSYTEDSVIKFLQYLPDDIISRIKERYGIAEEGINMIGKQPNGWTPKGCKHLLLHIIDDTLGTDIFGNNFYELFDNVLKQPQYNELNTYKDINTVFGNNINFVYKLLKLKNETTTTSLIEEIPFYEEDF